jgi:very-short-patch-repair endonuclease
MLGEHDLSVPLPLVGRGQGWGWQLGTRAMSKRDDQPRTWARLDRSVPAPPQRSYARQMRSAPTEAERKLWWHLRHRSPGRQFAFPQAGSDQAVHRRLRVSPGAARRGDRRRSARVDDSCGCRAHYTKTLEANGYRVLRFWNNDVLGNIDGVLEVIQRAMSNHPHP